MDGSSQLHDNARYTMRCTYRDQQGHLCTNDATVRRNINMCAMHAARFIKVPVKSPPPSSFSQLPATPPAQTASVAKPAPATPLPNNKSSRKPAAPAKAAAAAAPTLQIMTNPSPNWRTSLCENHKRGHCTYGYTCGFAHGPDKLRCVGDKFPPIVYLPQSGMREQEPPLITPKPKPSTTAATSSSPPTAKIKPAEEVEPMLCEVCSSLYADERWLPCCHAMCAACMQRWRGGEEFQTEPLRCHVCASGVHGVETLPRARALNLAEKMAPSADLGSVLEEEEDEDLTTLSKIGTPQFSAGELERLPTPPPLPANSFRPAATTQNDFSVPRPPPGFPSMWQYHQSMRNGQEEEEEQSELRRLYLEHEAQRATERIMRQQVLEMRTLERQQLYGRGGGYFVHAYGHHNNYHLAEQRLLGDLREIWEKRRFFPPSNNQQQQ